MKKSSFNTNVEKMRRITNSLEQKGDTEQLRYIRDGLYHVGGLGRLAYLKQKAEAKMQEAKKFLETQVITEAVRVINIGLDALPSSDGLFNDLKVSFNSFITTPFTTTLDFNKALTIVIHEFEKAKNDANENKRHEKTISGLGAIIKLLSNLKKKE